MKIVLGLLASLFVVSLAFAADDQSSGGYAASTTQVSLQQEVAQDESNFHIFLGGGWTSSSYSNFQLYEIVRSLESDRASKISFSGEVGFYWNLSPKLLFGFDLGTVLSSYDSKSQNKQFVMFPFALSTMYSFGSRVGSGVFLRFDFGPTFFLYPTPPMSSGGGALSSASDFTLGWGSALMLGYAFPMSHSTSFMLNSSLAVRSASYEGFRVPENAFRTLTYGLSAGFLF